MIIGCMDGITIHFNKENVTLVLLGHLCLMNNFWRKSTFSAGGSQEKGEKKKGKTKDWRLERVLNCDLFRRKMRYASEIRE